MFNTGEELKKYREGLGLSQKKFGEEVGYSASYIAGLEKGHDNISDKFKTDMRNYALRKQKEVDAAEEAKEKDVMTKVLNDTDEKNAVNQAKKLVIYAKQISDCDLEIKEAKKDREDKLKEANKKGFSKDEIYNYLSLQKMNKASQLVLLEALNAKQA